MTDNKLKLEISYSQLFKVFVAVLVCAFIYYARNIVLLVLTAIVVASFVSNVADKLSKYRLPRALSVIFVYLLSLVVLAGLFYTVVPNLIDEVQKAVSFASEHLSGSSIFGGMQKETFDSLEKFITGISQEGLVPYLENAKSLTYALSTGFIASLASVFGGVFNIVLIFIISLYMSLRPHGIEAFIKIITPLKHEEYIIDLWRRTQGRIALWIKSQFMLGLTLGVIVFFLLWILGVQYKLLLSILTVFLELIPGGFVISSLVAVAISYFQGGMDLFIISSIAFIVLAQIENYFIQPMIVGRVTGINPIMVIISLVAGFQVFGMWGLVLAMPIAVFLLELTNDLEKSKIIDHKNSSSNNLKAEN